MLGIAKYIGEPRESKIGGRHGGFQQIGRSSLSHQCAYWCAGRSRIQRHSRACRVKMRLSHVHPELRNVRRAIRFDRRLPTRHGFLSGPVRGLARDRSFRSSFAWLSQCLLAWTGRKRSSNRNCVWCYGGSGKGNPRLRLGRWGRDRTRPKCKWI